MRRGTFVAVLVTAMLALPSATALGSADPGTQEAPSVDAEACAPPCGEINPRLMFSFPELEDKRIQLEQGDAVTFSGKITFWADTDDEGYSPRDPQQAIEIRFSFPRLPPWAQMSVEPSQIEVPVNTCPQCFKPATEDPSSPEAHWAFSTGINLTVEAVEDPEVTPGYDYGKLQLFAKSTESGIYNPGYGIREVRVDPGADEDLSTSSTDENGAPGPSVLVASAVLATVAAAAAIRRDDR